MKNEDLNVVLSEVKGLRIAIQEQDQQLYRIEKVLERIIASFPEETAQLVVREAAQHPDLVRIIDRFKLTHQEAEEVIGIRTEYQTDYTSIMRLKDRGYALCEIENIYMIREGFRGTQKPTLVGICRLYESFIHIDLDPEDIQLLIDDIQATLQRDFGSMSLDDFVRYGHKEGILDPYLALNLLESGEPFPGEDHYDENSDPEENL